MNSLMQSKSQTIVNIVKVLPDFLPENDKFGK